MLKMHHFNECVYFIFCTTYIGGTYCLILFVNDGIFFLNDGIFFINDGMFFINDVMFFINDGMFFNDNINGTGSIKKCNNIIYIINIINHFIIANTIFIFINIVDVNIDTNVI